MATEPMGTAPHASATAEDDQPSLCGCHSDDDMPPSEVDDSEHDGDDSPMGSCWSFGDKPLEAFLKMGYDDGDQGVSNGMLDNVKKDVWESLPHPIIIDSGASTSVLPLSWCAHVQTTETDASRRGEHYTAANGGKIYNRGDKIVTMMSREGHKRNTKFTSCDVERALGSLSGICNHAHTAVFNAPGRSDGSYIYNVHNGERMELQHKDGVFVLDTKVPPSRRQANPFGGQGR